MTPLLETALERLRRLPESEQDHFAAKILRDLDVVATGKDESAAEAPTAHERGKHLAGTLKGGPSDLATNPAYLEGLGESSMQ